MIGVSGILQEFGGGGHQNAKVGLLALGTGVTIRSAAHFGGYLGNATKQEVGVAGGLGSIATTAINTSFQTGQVICSE